MPVAAQLEKNAAARCDLRRKLRQHATEARRSSLLGLSDARVPPALEGMDPSLPPGMLSKTDGDAQAAYCARMAGVYRRWGRQLIRDDMGRPVSQNTPFLEIAGRVRKLGSNPTVKAFVSGISEPILTSAASASATGYADLLRQAGQGGFTPSQDEPMQDLDLDQLVAQVGTTSPATTDRQFAAPQQNPLARVDPAADDESPTLLHLSESEPE
jgi:hypothetical protein